jgi:ribonuclease Z
MIFAEVTATSVTKICITHFHGDHCLGLAGMCQRLSLDRVPHAVEIYFPATGQVFYDRLRRASIYHAVAQLVPKPIKQPGVVFEDSKITIEAKRLDHSVETFGYRLQEKDRRTMLPEKLAELGIRGPAIGELVKKGSLVVDGKTINVEDVSLHKHGQSVAFVMDTRPCQAAIDLAKGVDLLVIESTYLSAEKEEAHDHGHMTAAQAATIAREAGAKKLVLTHFSQRYQSVDPFLEEAKPIFENAVAAKDGKRIPIERPAKLGPTA